MKSRKEMEKNEDVLNCHAIQFCRLLGVCDGNNCARRLKSALMNQNTYPPSLYFTIKDHKPMVPGEPLPARPVCGATKAHNAQLGFMLVKVLDGVSDILAKQHDYESLDTQDTLAVMESKVNNQNTRDLVIFSTDVKSLYPSLDAKQCVAIITKLVKDSRLVVEGVDWDQAVLYLAVTLTRDKVDEFGLQEIVPAWRRAGGRGRPPGITTKEVRGPLQEEKDWERSLFFPPIRRATEEEKKLILALCVGQGLLAAFEGHLYSWHREVRSQVEGLGIGEDLTRAVARLIMLDWDMKFITLAEENKLTTYMYKRFVDDTANAMEAISPGTRWGEEEGRMVMLPHLVEEDMEVEPDGPEDHERGGENGKQHSSNDTIDWRLPIKEW